MFTGIQLQIDWIAYFKDMFPNSQPFSADYSELIVLHEEALFNTCGIIIEYSKNETVQRYARHLVNTQRLTLKAPKTADDKI